MPFIARWPGKIPAGTTSDHISAQYDMMATLAELTGRKLEDIDGISLLHTLLGNNEEQQQHAYLYFEYHARGGQLAVRLGEDRQKESMNSRYKFHTRMPSHA